MAVDAIAGVGGDGGSVGVELSLGEAESGISGRSGNCGNGGEDGIGK